MCLSNSCSACCIVFTFYTLLSNLYWNMCDMVNCPTLIKYNVCSCTSASAWTTFPTRIRKIHQVVLGFNIDNQLMIFSDSIWQDFPDTRRSTRVYMIFYQGGTIDHGTHVLGPVSQLSAYSEYNVACNSGMALANFRMLIHELFNKDPYIVP